MSSAAAVRLVGGTNQLEGRAEVYVNNNWGSICRDNWDSKDAKVFCNQLGGYPVESGNCCYAYQQGGLSVFMGDVQCGGNETFITDCVHSTSNTCSQSQVVGVRCQGKRIFYFMVFSAIQDLGEKKVGAFPHLQCILR